MKLKASTLLETIISLTILTISFGIFTKFLIAILQLPLDIKQTNYVSKSNDSWKVHPDSFEEIQFYGKKPDLDSIQITDD